MQGAEIVELIVADGESAKNLDSPGMERLLALVEERKVDTVIIARLDRLTCSVKGLAGLLERFPKWGVSLVSVAEPPSRCFQRMHERWNTPFFALV